MSFKAGTSSAIYLSSKAGAVTNIGPYTDTASFPQSSAMLEVSVLGTAAKAFITGLTDGDQLTLSGPYDVTMTTLLYDLKAAQAVGSAAAAYVWGPGGSVASQMRSAGSFLVQNVTTSTGVGGRAEWSASLQVSGAVTNGTF